MSKCATRIFTTKIQIVNIAASNLQLGISLQKCIQWVNLHLEFALKKSEWQTWSNLDLGFPLKKPELCN